MAEELANVEIIPHEETIDYRQQLYRLRRHIAYCVNESYLLALHILETEQPDLPDNVAREIIAETWTDGSLRNLNGTNEPTEIEKALIDAWQEIESLKEQQNTVEITDAHPEMLNIYGLSSWGDNAVIAGTRRSLLLLEQAAKEARRMGKAEIIDAVASDGEPYKIYVFREKDEEIKKRPYPYYDAESS